MFLAEYYGAEGSGKKPFFQINRDRCLIEDSTVQKLAGAMPYTEQEANPRPALVHMTEEELVDLL